MAEPAEQWIPAAQARQLVGDSLDDCVAICTRANAGLIKASADLLIVDGKKFENAVFPSEFWWAKGHAALGQNWATGDFSTHIDRNSLWQAFGVHFALDGLLQMLPIEQRAKIARSVSVVGKDEWLNALAARRFAYERAGINPSFAADAILDACRLGYITARAVLMQRADGERPNDWTKQEREWDIPVWFWNDFTEPGSSSQIWERGIFSGRGRAPDARCSITLTGVYFLAESLSVLLPHAAQKASTSAPVPNPGGRPRKEFWDDLWCAVWGQVFRAELMPKRQADIERAMLAWVVANSHDVSESAIKPLARKMFDEMAREGKNP